MEEGVTYVKTPLIDVDTKTEANKAMLAAIWTKLGKTNADPTKLYNAINELAPNQGSWMLDYVLMAEGSSVKTSGSRVGGMHRRVLIHISKPPHIQDSDWEGL